ncbi:MAG: NAD(P)H-hydrate dehydratase [Candidatus Aminicenantales bacterium]
MKILTSAQMREIDRQTIENIGIPGPILMENAGLQVFRVLRTLFPDLTQERVVIVAGKGNNGGDGLVVARHLLVHGATPLVLLLAVKEEVRGDAGLNLKIAEAMGIPIREIRTPADWKKSRPILHEATILVDAIFGTGLTKPAEGLYALAIEDINKMPAFKLAVDVPSGLSSDSSEIMGPAVRADLTVALGAPKIPHVFPPAEEYVGQFLVANISLPPRLLASAALKLEMIDQSSILPLFKKRKRDSHKGSYGHLLIIAGSLGKTGAAVMAARAAYKTGAGLVTVATARTCLPIIARSMVELMTEPLAETEAKTISAEAVPRAQALAEGKNAIVIGPGLSTEASTLEFFRKLIPSLKKPLIIDADGLNILALKDELLKKLPQPTILTPHPGEFARLVGLSVSEVLKKKLELAPAFASRHGVYLILKGYRTLIAAPNGHVFINPTGNPGMATGGTGDVLSGMIGALLMEQKDPLQAAIAAVYLHGLSGDLAAEQTGERGLVAGDLIRFLPRALRSLEKEAERA